MRKLIIAAGAAIVLAGAAPAWSETVKITPLGSHDGEFCGRDRALILEDPNGTRFLYDPGRTVAGPNDPRLGRIDVVLLSSVHSDHIGDRRIPKVNAGTCAKPDTSVSAAPYSNTAMIVAKTGAMFVASGQMSSFLGSRIAAAGGKKSQALKLRPGGKRFVNGVKLAAIPTVHSNGASPVFLQAGLASTFGANGMTAYAGPDSGFVITFTNGLVVYLSGDTGHNANMDTIVRRYYKATLAIMNIGDIATMGPEEAAWAVNELIKPRAAMATHANEEATRGGKVVAGSKTDKFRKGVKRIPVYVPLSGRTMEFDGKAKCVKGCGS